MVTDLKDILEIILALVLCVLIIWLAYKFSRIFALRTGGRFSGRYMHEIERIAVGTGSYITILQCGTGYYLVGVTQDNISILAELDKETLQELPEVHEAAEESEFFMKLKSELENIKNKRNVR
jgi:flagellar protein FliO/FliZ